MSNKIKSQSKRSTAKYKKYKAAQDTQKTNIWLLMPIIFIISVLPFIVKLRTYNAHLSEFPWFSYNDIYNDFFLYNKQTFFLLAVTIMAVTSIFKAYIDKRSIVFTRTLIPLAVYAALALLSSLISKYRSYSFRGIHEHFESIFVILGYCLIVYYCLQYIRTEDDVRLIVNCFVISVIVMSLLGLTQYFGKDFFSTTFGRKLILPKSHWATMDSLEFTFEKNRVYLSFYNPNYVGTYSAMAISFLIILASLTRKRVYMIPIYLLAAIGISISLIGSESKTGLVGLVVSLIFSLIILIKYVIKHFYLSIPLLLLFLSVVFLYNKANDNILRNQLAKVTSIKKTEHALKDITTGDDEVVINYKGNSLHVKYLYDEALGNFLLYDDFGNPVPYEFDLNNYNFYINDNRFPNFKLGPALYEDLPCFYISIDNYDWYFSNQTSDEGYYHINIYGKPDKIISAPHALFSDYEPYASGRGYIWSRTIPMLKKYFILGSGADTFAIAFPQQDYVGLYNNGYSEQLMTKPHNLYLQMGVQTGVLSLIAYLVFYAMYFISSIKLYIKCKFKSYYSQVGIAILVASVSYMVVSFANDSTLTVAPVFWGLMGLGISVNRLAKPYIEEELAADKARLEEDKANTEG